MENASKALIIAGAILLSILIIALGMNVFNSANDSVSKANLSKEEVAVFNRDFEGYEGKQKGSSVRSLISKVNASNTNETETGDGRTITLGGDVTDAGAVKTNKTYTVELVYDSNSGLITGINIKN